MFSPTRLPLSELSLLIGSRSASYRYRQGVLPRAQERRARANQLGGARRAKKPAGAQDRGDRADGLVCRGCLARAVRNRGSARRVGAPP
jgi:hypothetical protein